LISLFNQNKSFHRKLYIKLYKVRDKTFFKLQVLMNKMVTINFYLKQQKTNNKLKNTEDVIGC